MVDGREGDEARGVEHRLGHEQQALAGGGGVAARTRGAAADGHAHGGEFALDVDELAGLQRPALHQLAQAFDDLLIERRVRPTLLQPLWHVAGFALGAATAMLGDKAADMQAAAAAGVARKVLVLSGQTLTDEDKQLADEIWPSIQSALTAVSS